MQGYSHTAAPPIRVPRSGPVWCRWEMDEWRHRPDPNYAAEEVRQGGTVVEQGGKGWMGMRVGVRLRPSQGPDYRAKGPSRGVHDRCQVCNPEQSGAPAGGHAADRDPATLPCMPAHGCSCAPCVACDSGLEGRPCPTARPTSHERVAAHVATTCPSTATGSSGITSHMPHAYWSECVRKRRGYVPVLSCALQYFLRYFLLDNVTRTGG